jgi:hypothetical protein
MYLRRFHLALLLGLCCGGATARAEPTAEQLRNEARACRERAVEGAQIYESLTNREFSHLEFMRADLPQVKAAYDAAAAGWKKAADAYDAYDTSDPAAQALRTDAEKLGQACAAWRERMEIREKQASIAPWEGHFYQRHSGAGPAAKAALGAMIESRKNAADAWGVLAEATVPGADATKLLALREQALKAAGEVELAIATHDAIDRRETFTREAGASPEAATLIESLKKLDDQRLAVMRDELTRAAKLRDLDRRRAEVEDQLRHIRK